MDLLSEQKCILDMSQADALLHILNVHQERKNTLRLKKAKEQAAKKKGK